MSCPVCGHANPVDSRFCSNCGTKLVESVSRAGERKLVSVLFADVVDSTRLTRLLGAETWADVMNGAFSIMNEAVATYGGTVGRLMGDGILAFFGVPTTHEDDAERAVLAALRIRQAMGAYDWQTSANRGAASAERALGVRVGVATGPSVLTTVGDDVRAEFTAMGETANLAARLQGLAEPGTVLVAGDTHALVRDAFEFVPLGARQVKGLVEPVRVFEVLGPVAGGFRRRGVEGLVAPIVGRDKELAALRERVTDVTNGTGSWVSLIGEAGLGKSRLVAEVRSRAHHQHGGELRWFEGRGLSYAQTVPYFVLRGALLSSFGAIQSDPPTVVRQRLAAAVAEGDWDGEEHEPYLQLMLAVEDETATVRAVSLDGGGVARAIAAAFNAYMRHVARHPTVLVLEDLHWADQATIALVTDLAELTRELPFLVLALMRPDRRATTHSLPDDVDRRLGERHVRLELEPLDPSNASELLMQLLGGGPLPPVLAAVAERSDGNPFYLEEVLRSLIDAERLTAHGGRWQVNGDLSDLDVPETLSGVLGARIDRLPEDTRRVAQTAAVIGRTFESSVLERVLERGALPWCVADVDSHLDTLTHEELVRELRPAEEYSFKHVLTQEAVYERLLTRQRTELHRLVAEALEVRYRDRLDEFAGVLAGHYERAEQWLAFAGHAGRASRRARRVNALDEAVDLDTRAVAALDRVDEAQRDDEWRTAITAALIGLTESEMLQRRHEDPTLRDGMLERSERAVELARHSGDERTLVKALVLHANVHVLSGFPVEGFTHLAEAHDAAQRLGDDQLFVAPFWAATELIVGDDPATAADRLGQVADMAAAVGDRAVLSHSLGSRGVALARLGRFEEALASLVPALEAAYSSGSAIKEADVTLQAGAALMEMGELETAMRFITHGRDKALKYEGRECAANGLWLSGRGNMTRRRLSTAIDEFNDALRVAAGTEYEQLLYTVVASRAACRLQTGEAASVTDVQAQLDRAVSMHDHYGTWTTAHLLATTLIDLGRSEEALAHLDGALGWYRERGMKPYVLRALKDKAAALTRLDRPAEAERVQVEADAIAASLGGPFDISVLGEPGSPPTAVAA